MLTEAALERYGLPVALTETERLAGRIPEGHKVIKQLARADWKLTKRGFGPWARIYRPAKGSERACVQLCIPSWHALDSRHWGEAAQLPPAELARLLGAYASRVMTPRGSTAVTGLELMTALHPPTRASEPDADGKRHSEHNPGSLGKDPVECAPCEAPDGHPLLADLPRFHIRGPGEKLFEEAYDWARPMTDAECTLRHLVGIDVNMAFAAGANGLIVGLGAPTYVKAPVFDAKLPGSWLVDLSHVDLSRVKVGKDTWADLDPSLLPSPFTPKGERPDGPAWYATPTVAYAVELGYGVAPIEAYVRYDNGRYLDGWYQRLRDAYLATMADLGVGADLAPADFLAAMDGYKERDPQLAIVVSASRRRSRAVWASCVNAPAGRDGGPVSRGGPCPARRGGRTSARRSSPAPGSTCTVRSSSMRRSPASTRSRSCPTASCTRPTAPARWTSCPTGTASRCPAASSSASTPAWSSTRAPRPSCGAKESASSSTPRSSTSPGTSRTAPSPMSTTESRGGR
ncbi:hypothetical protein SVIO_001730 [Streptomyces violaceusniger]|uniref:Transcriptional regulator n=1 Tax=Streptomyces violaceusniger TaxID=68280 RepID=A0A4D4KSJ3_STRVO|nr:hypothetical protein SVIO_001730 [Streptomyces violaceusniger]